MTGVVVFFEVCGMSTPTQMVYCILCTFLSLVVLMLCKPYGAPNSNRVQIFSRCVILLSYIHGLTTFVVEPESSECGDETIVSFADFTAIMLYLVPSFIALQVLYEFAAVPVLALHEERPEVRVLSCKFWSLLLLEGGYGYHVKDATPMDRFARFEAFMSSGAGVEAMQQSATGAKEPSPKKANVSERTPVEGFEDYA